MAHHHGDAATAWRIFRTSDLPYRRRVPLAILNLLRRIWTPPHDCCGRPGEVGC